MKIDLKNQIENKKIGLTIVGIVFVLSVSCSLVAFSHGLWHELWITLGYLILAGVLLFVLLRREA